MANNRLKIFYINILCVLYSLFTSHFAFAQLVDQGQNPPSLKWKKITTPHFDLIYPSSFGEEAQRTARLLEYFSEYETMGLKDFPERTPVLLQNQTVISNGFVTLAPERVELFSQPPQDNEPNDWLSHLTIHELRHVAQINHVIQTKKIDWPLIQEIQFALFGAALPVWFIEGDAVITETALSSAGRGRLPDWEKEFRANILSGKDYSYSKYLMGSYKDNIPDYYRLGYFMSSWMQRHYTDSVYSEILRSAALRSPLPGAFSSSLHKYTGKRNVDLFRATTAELKEHWQAQLNKTKPQEYPALNRRKGRVKTDYLHPHRLDDGSIICLKSGKGDAPALIQINAEGKERKVRAIGPQLTPWFDYAAGVLVWDELKYDPRYQYRDYSVINSYNLHSGHFQQLSHRSRLFSPSLSADGKKIIAVKNGLDNQFYLVLLDATSGEELWVSRAFEEQLHYPALDTAAERIVFMLTGAQGRSMGIYHIAQDRFEIIRKADRFDSSLPQFAGDQIIFQSHFNGIDNIYSLDPESGAISQLSQAKFSAVNPHYSPEDHQLIFNNFVAGGMNIARIDLDSLGNRNSAPFENTFRNYSAPAAARAPQEVRDLQLPDTQYPVSDYRGIGRLFSFHSISPTGSAEDEHYTLGLRLKSHNLLNTMAISAGYDYNLSVRSNEYRAAIAYKRYYPVVNLEYVNRKREGSTGSGSDRREFTWREHATEFNLQVPLNFTKRNYLYGLMLSTGSSYTSRYTLRPDAPERFIREIQFPWVNRFLFVRQRIRSQRDLAPRWGQRISLLHQELSFDPALDGRFFSFESLFYFPGLLKHHSFSVSFNYQESSGVYQNIRDLPEISGAAHFPSANPLENTLLLDYRFPLAYPDWELGSFAYIKRIKAGLFADYENIKKGDKISSPDSFGFELRADMHLLRLYTPEFDIGTKVVFFNDKTIESPVFELILNYNLAL